MKSILQKIEKVPDDFYFWLRNKSFAPFSLHFIQSAEDIVLVV